jgi:hypothetical protein
VLRGYHSEAAVISWDLLEHASDVARLATELTTAPLRLEGIPTLAGPVLSVRDTIVNFTPVPVPSTGCSTPVSALRSSTSTAACLPARDRDQRRGEPRRSPGM